MHVQPGETLNPDGGVPQNRPYSIRRALRARAGADPNDAGEGKLAARFADKLIADAWNGKRDEVQAVERLIEQLEGPQRQGLDVTADVVARVVVQFDEDGE